MKKPLPMLPALLLAGALCLTAGTASSQEAALAGRSLAALAPRAVPLHQTSAPASPVLITLSGRVLADNGEGLPGVNIGLKGTTTGTVSDKDGGYSLAIPDESADGTLVFSFIGYATEEVAIGGRTQIDVKLLPDIKALSEVVVIGYGTQKRSDLTGTVASVKAEKIKNLPVRSLNEAIQGRVAGVQVTKEDGSPGAGSDIIIRGAGSINGMPPLYIVDGIRMGTGYNFNVQDVASIEVLKDASAAAIYGAQAAGGVILVTTKRGGQNDKMSVSLNAYYGVRQPVNLYQLLGRDQYFRARQAFGTDVTAWGNPAGLPDTDWLDELYGNGQDQNYTLSLSGGTAKASYYVSGNYQREDGIRLDNSFKRYNLRINSDYQLGKRLKVGESLMAWKGVFNRNPDGTVNIPFRSVPTMPVRDAGNAVGGWGRQPVGGYFAGDNPVAGVLSHHRNDQSYAVEGNVYADLEILSGLNFRTTLGTSFLGSNNSSFREAYDYGSLANPNASLVKEFDKQENYTANFVLTYAKTLGLHDFRVMAGYEAYREDKSTLKGESSEFAVPLTTSFELNTNPSTQKAEGGLFPQRRLLSQFGRLNYSYAGKYLLTANIRRDGSDRFGPANKFGVFPSFSAGWRLSEEAFLKNAVPALSNLKLRGGYGVLGNDGIDQYLYQQSYTRQNITGLPDGTRVQGYGLDMRLANDQIKWEEVRQTDIGLDVGLWSDRLTLALDWYSRQTQDMLYEVPVTYTAGLDGEAVFMNIGKMSNKGVEIAAEYRGRMGGFTYQLGANAAFNRNKVLLLDGVGNNPINEGGAGEYLESVVGRTDVGYPMSQFYGYVAEGIFSSDDEVSALNQQAKETAVASGMTKAGDDVFYQEKETGAGDLRFRDVDGDGKITVKDKTFIGNPWPKMIYGINVNLGYKGFDLALQFQGVQGLSVYNGARHFTKFIAGDYNTTADVFNASFFDGNGLTGQPRLGFVKTEDGKEAYVRDPNKNYTRIFSYFVEDGSFLKLRNVQLGYSLPAGLLQKSGMANARIYVMAQNLLTFTKYSGLDPEIGGTRETGGIRARGIDNIGTYPRTRLFALGLDVTF